MSVTARPVGLADALDDLVERTVRSDDHATPADRRQVWELIARWALMRTAFPTREDNPR